MKVLTCGSVFILSFPLMMLIASSFKHTDRPFVMELGIISLNLISMGIMFKEFDGKGEYYKASMKSSSILPNKFE